MSTSPPVTSEMSLRWATVVSAGTCMTVAGVAAAIMAPSAPFADIGRVLMLTLGPALLALVLGRWRASRVGTRRGRRSGTGWILLAALLGIVVEVGLGTVRGKAKAAENTQAWKKAYRVTHVRVAALGKTVSAPSDEMKTASLQVLIRKYAAAFRPSKQFGSLIARRLEAEGQSIEIRDLRALMLLGPKSTKLLARTYTLRRLAMVRDSGGKNTDLAEARRLHEDLWRLQCPECVAVLIRALAGELRRRVQTLEPPALTDALLLSLLSRDLVELSTSLRQRLASRGLRDASSIDTLDALVQRYWRIGELGLPVSVTRRLTSRINQLTVAAWSGTASPERRVEIIRLFRRADVRASIELQRLLSP